MSRRSSLDEDLLLGDTSDLEGEGDFDYIVVDSDSAEEHPRRESPPSPFPRPPREEEGSSMDWDNLSTDEEPPLRRPRSKSSAAPTTPPPTAPPPSDQGQRKRSQAKTPTRDLLWAYEPLNPHMGQVQRLLKGNPEILEAIQETYHRVVELVRSRPCKMPGSTLPCMGKVETPTPPVSQSRRYVSVHTVLPPVDAETWTGPLFTTHAEVQTEGTTVKTEGTQTDDSTTKTTPHIEQMDAETSTEQPAVQGGTTQTEATVTRTDGTQTDDTAAPTAPSGVPARREAETTDATPPAAEGPRPEDFVGWRMVEGRQVYVTAPRPGCWACGDPGHRAPQCADRLRHQYRYCYRCGLGNVSVKECPVHGAEWRARGPYRPGREHRPL